MGNFNLFFKKGNPLNVSYELGNNKTALKYYEEALSIKQEIDDKEGKSVTLNNIAAIYQDLDNTVKALEHWEQSLAIKRELGALAGEAVCCWNIGCVYEEQYDFANAKRYMSQAVQIAEQIGHPELQTMLDGLKQVRSKRRA